MWCNLKLDWLLLTTLLFAVHQTNAYIYSNSSSLEQAPDDIFFGMPVYFKSNVMIKSLYNKDHMKEHLQRILKPLTPYILNDDVKVYKAQRRGDFLSGVGSAGGAGDGFSHAGGFAQAAGFGAQSSAFGAQSSGFGAQSSGFGAQSNAFGGQAGGFGPESIVQVEQYDLPFIAAAQIGTYTFTCRQSNGDLVIYNPTLTANNQLRSIPSFTEFQIHPRPGIWWWVQCVTFETGGAGMGITGVQKPGGDAGIDPNALKSLVG